MVDKICPFLLAANHIVSECLEKKCGLWNESAHGCGLRMLKEIRRD